MFKETQMWDSLPTVIPLVEKIMARVVASVQAQNSKYTTIILLSHTVPSQIVSKKICFRFILLSNYVSYFPVFIFFSLLKFSPFSDYIRSSEAFFDLVERNCFNCKQQSV